MPLLLENSPLLTSSATVLGISRAVRQAVTAHVVELLEAPGLGDTFCGLAMGAL
jgi:hypothetical protein